MTIDSQSQHKIFLNNFMKNIMKNLELMYLENKMGFAFRLEKKQSLKNPHVPHVHAMQCHEWHTKKHQET